MQMDKLHIIKNGKTKIAHLLHSLGVDIYVRLLLNNIDTDSFENIVIHGTKDTTSFWIKNKKNLKKYKISILEKYQYLMI
jgi:hypothetical protein